MTPTLSHPIPPALFPPPDRPNSTLYHPQLDASLYKTWELIILGILAGFVCLVTICGNLTVLMSFFLERSIRQPSNYFIASLAVSDLLIGTISMPLYTTYILTWKNWPLGEILCDLWLSIDYTACLCSIYTIFCITIDRFCSIRLPTKYRVWRTERKVLFVVFLTWAIPILVFFTSIFGWQHFVGHRSVPSGKCYVQYMDEAFFNCFLQVGYFWTTLIAMFVLYAGIYRVALDLHRRSDEKRRRHLNSLATMAGCTIGQLGTVIGMSHGPRHCGGLVSGMAVKKEVETVTETVNVTSGYSSHRVGAGGGGSSHVEQSPGDDCSEQEVRIDLARASAVGTRSGVLDMTESQGCQSRESASAVCISKEKLSDSSFQRLHLRPTVESITSLKTFATRKRHLLGKHRRNSELGLSAAAFYKAVEHIQECLLLSAGQPPTRGNLELPRGRNIEGKINVKCSEDATRHSDGFTLGEDVQRSGLKASAAVSDDLQEILSITKEDSDVETTRSCNSEERRKSDTSKTRSYSLCCNYSPKRVIFSKRQYGRRVSQLQGKRSHTLISSHSHVNAELTGVYLDPELVISPKCAYLEGNDGNQTTISPIQRKPLSHLIPLDTEVNLEWSVNPKLVISPNFSDLTRNDTELEQTMDYSDDLAQPMGQIPKGDFSDEFNSWTRFESEDQCGPRSITLDRKQSMLLKYRTEGHLEFCSGQTSMSRATQIFVGYQNTLPDHGNFLDVTDIPTNDSVTFCGDTGADDIIWERNLGICSAPLQNEHLEADNIWESNVGFSPLPKLESHVQRGNVSVIPVLDHETNPARSAASPKRQMREVQRSVDEIFHTQSSSEHPISYITNTTPDHTVVNDNQANPIHTIFLTMVMPETSAPTSFSKDDDVMNDANDDVINNDVICSSRIEKKQQLDYLQVPTSISKDDDVKVDVINDDVISNDVINNSRIEKKQLDYLRVPDLVTPLPSPANLTLCRSRTEITGYDQGFEDRFPPGLKRLLQGSRRGQEGDPHRRPSEKHLKNENRARKALRTITIILGAFVVCWTPWHVLSLIIGFCSTSVVCVSPVLYDISYWLCYFNSPINPFCYAFVNQQFKKTFVRVLRLRWHRT